MTKSFKKRILVDTVSGKVGGIKTLIKDYIYYFKIYAPDIEAVFYVTPQVYEDVKNMQDENVSIKFLKFFSSKTYLRVLWEQLILPFILLKYDYLYSITHIFPFFTNKKGVLLIHQPNFFTDEYFKIPEIYMKLVNLSLRKASFVIAQTEFIKKNIVQKFGIEADKIKLLPQGISSEITNYDQSKVEEAFKEKVKNLKEQKPSICAFISMYAKHKNFERLIESLTLLDESIREKLALVLTLPEEHFDFYLKELIDKNNLGENVINFGVLNKNELSYLYKSLDFFISPSLLESFGLPLIEAMHFEIPVLVSDLEYAHNVCEDAAIYFNPFTQEDIADKIKLVLSKPKSEHTQKLSNQADKYCWKRHIKELVKLMKEI